MRGIVISDVHGNIEALEAVLAAAAALRGDDILCLGDLVGYGPDPSACIDRVRSVARVVLMGNHDAAAAGIISTEDFNPYAEAAIRWTREQLDGERAGALSSLPLAQRHGDHLMVHASPLRPAAWEYIFTVQQARSQLATCEAARVFIGHTHVPVAYSLDAAGNAAAIAPRGTLRMRPDARYLVNVGSVGQPRDGDPDACFCVVDDEAGTVEWVRVPYDVTATQRKMAAANLPERLIQRLSHGR